MKNIIYITGIIKKGCVLALLILQTFTLHAQRTPAGTNNQRPGMQQQPGRSQQLPGQLQDLNMTQDVSQINVDDMTDDQIRYYMRVAQERGVTQQQVEAGLRQRGMPDIQIQKLRSRIQKLGRDRQGTYLESERISEDRESMSDEDQLIQILETPDYHLEQEKKFRARIFGTSLFGNPSLTFEPSMNMATPGNYRIGPGDEIIIDVWGASEANFYEMVTPEGYIRIQNIGPVYVNGLTIEEANQRIIGRLSGIFSGLRGANPNTFAQANLGNVRRINVSLIGEVVQPGTYMVSSLSTVFNVLNAAGGPSSNGTFRDIQIVRNNKIIASLDLYQFLLSGEQDTNIRLEDQDVIRVGPYQQRVQLLGEIKRKEDLYELKQNETVSDLISYAGGFTDKAYTHQLRVKRNTLKERRIINVRHDQYHDFSLQAGDMINVEPILDRFENRVQITGAVYREGEYELTEGLTVKELIERAEGIRGDAFLERGTIYRTKEDYSTEVIPFNIRELMQDNGEDIDLQREDLIRISSIYDLHEEYYVEIKGEVRKPGVFPYMGSMNVEDLIMVSGGLLESASNSHIEVVRRFRSDEQNPGSQVAEIFTFNINRDLRLQQQDMQFTLQPFDMVFVRRSPGYQMQQTVQITGEVAYPGFYGIRNKNERISDLIQRAGGMTDEAYIKGATLIRKTEYFEQRLQEQRQIEKLVQLIEREQSITNNSTPLSEGDFHRSQRLSTIQQNKPDGRDDEVSESKRRRLVTLGRRDSVLLKDNIREEEAIGIDLVEILRNPGSNHDLLLEDGDILSIPKELQTVRLRGELLYPITVRYDRKNNFMHYVSRAGGFSSNAKKGKSYVVYANGSVDRTRNFLFFRNYPNIEPGAEIIVPEKPEKRRMTTQETIGIATGLATFSYLLITIINSTTSK